jgi:hypothetical protein
MSAGCSGIHTGVVTQTLILAIGKSLQEVFVSFRLIKSESYTLDRKKALEFATKHASLPHSPVERERDPKRVQRLIDILRDGKALPFQWATVLWDGQTVRMNGQHSLQAIVELGQEIPSRLSFHLDQYEADTRSDMIDLFRQFDQRWSGRSSQDIAGAYQGLMTDLVECDRKVMKVAAEGISWCKRTVLDDPAPTGDDTYDLLQSENLLPFFLWFNGIPNGRKELLKKEIVGAIWQTYERSQSGASKFWKEVSYGPDFFLDDKEPGSVLITELIQATDDEDFRNREFPARSVYYKKAIKAWNAFCAHMKVSTLRIAKAKGGKSSWPDVSHYGDTSESDAA